MEAHNLNTNSQGRTRYADTPIFEVINILKDKFHIYHRDAWKKIYSEYSSHILFHARKRAETIYHEDPEDIAQDIVSRVLEKLVLNIDGFDTTESIKNPNEQFKKFFGWLMTILEHEFIDITREQKRNREIQTEVKYFKKTQPLKEFEAKEESGFYDGKEKELYSSNIPLESRYNVGIAMKGLSDKQRDILIAFMTFGIQEGKFWKLPTVYKEILCKKYNCKSNTIDKIKLRAIEFLKKELNQ
jgi:RNA polymerase sigma factor (sigma-70 family)